jgi:hypothetical protein
MVICKGCPFLERIQNVKFKYEDMFRVQDSAYMKKTLHLLLLMTLIFAFAGCSSINGSQQNEPLSSDQATGTAIVARKYTEITKATLNPMTPFPYEIYPTEDWTGWSPSPSEIGAGDSGKSFDFWITSRFSIVLKELEYPVANLELHCIPQIALGRISNVEPVPPDYYVIRYEGSRLGKCTIQNGKFAVTINIINHP